MRQSLQNGTENSYQKFITKRDRSLLQSVSGITKCDSYYKVRRNNTNADLKIVRIFELFNRKICIFLKKYANF